MKSNVKDIWSAKYEPKTIDDYIVSDELKERLIKVMNELPNVMLFGSRGIGKGTFVNIMLNKLKFDYIRINASDENSIDDVRDKIKSFATALGTTKMKIVYLNECDRLSPQAQDALLQLVEDVHKITRFVFVGNYLNRIISELQSRCEIIEYPNPPIGMIGKHCVNILRKENITKIDKNVLALIIKKCYPDIRKTVNTLKLSIKDNSLTSMTITSYEDKFKDLLKHTVTQDLDSMRKILRTYQVPYIELYEYLFENLPGHEKVKSPGDAIIEIAEAMYRDYFMVSKEINFIGMVLRLYRKGII